MSKKKTNLNTATSSKLTEPHGIGKMADKSIKDHVKANGPFKDFEELKGAPAIGKKKTEIFKANFSLESQTEKVDSSTNSTQTKEDVNQLMSNLKI